MVQVCSRFFPQWGGAVAGERGVGVVPGGTVLECVASAGIICWEIG